MKRELGLKQENQKSVQQLRYFRRINLPLTSKLDSQVLILHFK